MFILEKWILNKAIFKNHSSICNDAIIANLLDYFSIFMILFMFYNIKIAVVTGIKLNRKKMLILSNSEL